MATAGCGWAVRGGTDKQALGPIRRLDIIWGAWEPQWMVWVDFFLKKGFSGGSEMASVALKVWAFCKDVDFIDLGDGWV